MFFAAGTYTDIEASDVAEAAVNAAAPADRVVAVVDHHVTTDAVIGDAFHAIRAFL